MNEYVPEISGSDLDCAARRSLDGPGHAWKRAAPFVFDPHFRVVLFWANNVRHCASKITTSKVVFPFIGLMI